MESFWWVLFSLLAGLCIGSFLNVAIHRLPAGQSIVDPPRSACPHCGEPLAARDNIPVVSFLWLRAHCRHCHAPISWRYPVVELTGGAMAVGCLLRFGPGGAAVVAFALMAVLLAVSCIDIDHRISPDRVILPAAALLYPAAAVLTPLSWRQGLVGAFTGAGILYLVAAGYRLLTRREGMGMGDVKLMVLIGAVIGWQGAVFTLFAAAFYGTLAGLLAMVRSGRGLKTAIPFGPFLSLGAATYLLADPELILRYQQGLILGIAG
ncbi:MAG: prepilin peptidase [Deltaproteobacteria bacterium]|nr:MAG: prepilin peptidase [Deltaproteobacteria bacterium]